MDTKDQLKDIPIDQVAEGVDKRWYVRRRTSRACLMRRLRLSKP